MTVTGPCTELSRSGCAGALFPKWRPKFDRPYQKLSCLGLPGLGETPLIEELHVAVTRASYALSVLQGLEAQLDLASDYDHPELNGVLTSEYAGHL